MTKITTRGIPFAKYKEESHGVILP
jgi:hypothetical protein